MSTEWSFLPLFHTYHKTGQKDKRTNYAVNERLQTRLTNFGPVTSPQPRDYFEAYIFSFYCLHSKKIS